MNLNFVLSSAQITYVVSDTHVNDEVRAKLYSIELLEDAVIATVELTARKALKRMNYWCSLFTYIGCNNIDRLLDCKGYYINGRIEACGYKNKWGWDNVALGEKRYYKLYFKGALPSGINKISIIDFGETRWANYQRYQVASYSFKDIVIINPRKNYLNYKSEYDVKKHIDQNNDGICGIYETIDDSGAKLACVKNGNEHCLIYLSSSANYKGKDFWEIGDIKAKLRNTPSGLMKAEWYNAVKGLLTLYVAFDGVSMIATNIKSEEIKYLKTYPTSNSNVGNSNIKQGTEWTGTGFALKNGYIVTNNHVVEGTTSIQVQGIKGSSVEYKAEVVAVDKNNDLALLRINYYRFDGFGAIPYSIKETLCEVGSDVFVLGYPLTTYKGEEIKLTNGIISSRSGYQGDVSTYQISAPVQPGNSGGPMFDKNGNVVGVVNAGIPGAENVGYAIKTSYLKSLINSTVSTAIIPQNNTLVGKSLPEKVKILRKYVFYIKCK